MDKRYQVFVSSTFLDLKEERAAVVSALLQLDAIPSGMELFPAADDDAWTLIERVISACDYYVLVIGGKYGSVDPETELSFTEKEFDFAVAHGKPVMAFLHSDPEAIISGKTEKTESSQAKLAAFRKKVEAKKHVKFWHTPDDLAGKVALSFANFTKTYPAVGWMRADVQTSTESLVELNDLRKQLQSLEGQLEATRSGPPPGTDHLSKGEDPVTFAVSYNVTGMVRPFMKTLSLTGVVNSPISWDELFSAAGPHLLDEVEQAALSIELNKSLTTRFRHNARREAFARLTDAKPDQSFNRPTTKVFLSTDDFGTLIIQFKALGLIARSSRRRSVNDKGAYWALTPYGDEHLTTLRAVSKVPRIVDVIADGEEEEEEEYSGGTSE
jgi:hypothetical protein